MSALLALCYARRDLAPENVRPCKCGVQRFPLLLSAPTLGAQHAPAT